MATIIPDGHFQVVLNWTSPMWTSGGGATTLGFRQLSEAPPSVDAAAAVAAIVENMLPRTTDTVTLTDARWATAEFGGLLIVNAPGAFSSTVAAPNSSMLLRKQTISRGPRGRGRSYWPQMVSETNVDEAGVINGADLTAINAAIAATVADWDAALIAQVLLQGDEGQSAPISPPPLVTGFFCDPKVATQRRRLRR